MTFIYPDYLWLHFYFCWEVVVYFLAGTYHLHYYGWSLWQVASHINRKSKNYILVFCSTDFCIILDNVTKLQSLSSLQCEKFKRKSQQRPNHTMGIAGLQKHLPSHVSCHNNGNVLDHMIRNQYLWWECTSFNSLSTLLCHCS